MCKQASILIDPTHKLGEVDEDIAVDREMYQCLVRRLIYLSHETEYSICCECD